MVCTIFWIVFLGGVCIAAAIFIAGEITWVSFLIGSMFLIFAIPMMSGTK